MKEFVIFFGLIMSVSCSIVFYYKFKKRGKKEVKLVLLSTFFYAVAFLGIFLPLPDIAEIKTNSTKYTSNFDNPAKLVNVYMNINPIIKNGNIGFSLETNLPDFTKLAATLHSTDDTYYKVNSDSIEIINGKGFVESFDTKGKNLPVGNYELTVFALASTKQNEEVLSVVGNDFKNLTGDLINNKNGISVEKTIPIVIKDETPAIHYEIKAVDDISLGSIIRKSLRIFVSNPQDLTQDKFKKLCQEIVEKYTSTTPVNALTLYFFDNERDIGGGYTLGMCTYYPNGNIGDAMNVQTGDYSSFKYKYTFTERDATKKPTDAEFEIYDYLMDLLIETDGSEEAEAECTKQTAEKFNITIEEVDNIFIKVSAYKLS